MRFRLVFTFVSLLTFAVPDLAQAQDDLIEDTKPSARNHWRQDRPARGTDGQARFHRGLLPVALIAHGKPMTQGRMSDQHARGLSHAGT